MLGQSVESMMRDFEMCAVQQCLYTSQMSFLFVNNFGDFPINSSSRMSLDQIVSILLRHYNSETPKLQIKSETDSLDLIAFMRKKNCSDHSEGLTMLVHHINYLSPQLPIGFGDAQYKSKTLRRAVMRYNRASRL